MLALRLLGISMFDTLEKKSSLNMEYAMLMNSHALKDEAFN